VAARASTPAVLLVVLGLVAAVFSAGCGDDERVLEATPRPTTPPIAAEELAYVSQRNSRAELHRISRFGAGFLNLSEKAGSINSHPSWSSDSTRLAFSSEREGSGDVYVMNSDGSGQVKLTSAGATDDIVEPSWSPSGAKIAFALRSGGNNDVWVMNSDGSGQTNLTPVTPSVDDQPAWSPGGTKIAFHSDRTGNGDVWVMNSDGSEPVSYTGASAADVMRRAYYEQEARSARLGPRLGQGRRKGC